VQLSHTLLVGSAVFDDPYLVSAAGLVPVLKLAELNGSTARLLSNGRLRAVSITSLLTVRQVDLPDDSAEPDDLATIPAVVLAGLSTRQRSELQERSPSSSFMLHG